MPPKRTTKDPRGGKTATTKQRSGVDVEPRLQTIKRAYTARTATLEKPKAKKIAVKSANEPIDVDKSGSDGEINLDTESDEPADVDIKPKAKAKAVTKPRQAPARKTAAAPRATAPAKSKPAPTCTALKRKASSKDLVPGSSDESSSSGDSSIEPGGRLTLAKLKRTVDKHAKWCPFVRMNKKLKVRMSMMTRVVVQNAGVSDEDESDDEDGEGDVVMVVDGRLEKVTGGKRGGRGVAQSTKQSAVKGAVKMKVTAAAEPKAKAAAKPKAQATKAGHMAPKSLSPGTIDNDRKAMHLDSSKSVADDDEDVTEANASSAGSADSGDESDGVQQVEVEDKDSLLSSLSTKKLERSLKKDFEDARDPLSSLTSLSGTPSGVPADVI
nr:hypothetical protein B0A51_18578 [Rachicladosporium sp. CCFEE 5018]